MAVQKRRVDVDVVEDVESGQVLTDTEIAAESVPEELDYLDPDDGTDFSLKISESFTYAGRNHIVVFEGHATLREGEHYALMAQRLADLVLFGLGASKEMFIAQKRADREGGQA
jgi:hypothetical protein